MKKKIEVNKTYRQLYGDNGTLRKDVRYFEVYGGRRSAKSFEVKQCLAITALTEPGHFIPMIRKVANTLKDSVYAEMRSFFVDNDVPFYENKTDKELILNNGSRFRGFGLDDAHKLKSLKGATVLWLEEGNEDSEDDFDTLDAGLSPTNYPGRIVITHNPMPIIQGSQHWLQKRFLNIEHELSKAVINKDANALVLRTWYKDNRFCPIETIRVLEKYKTTNPDKYKLWALGEFTTLEGCVFTNWDIVKEVPNGIEDIGVGLDFGFSNDPAAAVRVWMHGSDVYIKGLVYNTGLSNEMLGNKLRAAGVAWNDFITPDSAEPKSVEDIKRFGFKCVREVHKKANYKEDLVNRIKSFKLHLIEGDTDLVREFSSYSWARDKNNKQLPKLQDGDDHYVDAFIMRMHDYWQAKKLSAPKQGAAYLGL